MDRKVPRIPIARSRPPRSHPRNSQKNFLFRGPPPLPPGGTRSLSSLSLSLLLDRDLAARERSPVLATLVGYRGEMRKRNIRGFEE